MVVILNYTTLYYIYIHCLQISVSFLDNAAGISGADIYATDIYSCSFIPMKSEAGLGGFETALIFGLSDIFSFRLIPPQSLIILCNLLLSLSLIIDLKTDGLTKIIGYSVPPNTFYYILNNLCASSLSSSPNLGGLGLGMPISQ